MKTLVTQNQEIKLLKCSLILIVKLLTLESDTSLKNKNCINLNYNIQKIFISGYFKNENLLILNKLQTVLRILLTFPMRSTCSLEKLEIAKANKRNNLNKRHELFANCPHLKKLHFKT